MSAGGEIHIHVLIDSLGYGGAEGILLDFAAVAPSAGIRLSVGYLKEADGSPTAARLREVGIDPVLAPIRPRLSPAAVRLVRRHIGEAGPDLVHTHLGASDVLGGIGARLLGIPAVSTIHAPAHWRQDTLRERARARFTALARRRCSARVIAVSESARKGYLARGWDKPDRVVRIYNGIVGRPSPGTGRAVRAELGLQPHHLVVTMLSTLQPGKGHDVASQAMELLRHRFPDMRLLIVGDGPIRPGIEQMTSSLGGLAVMAGYREDVMSVLDATDVLLHPSRADAFPTTLLEAMAASVPSVATAVDGIVEIVDPGETGILLEPGANATAVASALELLVADQDLRGRLGRRGRERFEERFTAEGWVQRTRELYDEVIAA